VAHTWRKTAPIWQGNIIAGSKVMTQQGPLNRAFDAIKGEIGLKPEVMSNFCRFFMTEAQQAILLKHECLA
jgi:hypothetical protein